MPVTFKTIDHRSLTDNVFDLIARQWMLVTAGALDDFNTMTASWGGFGHLWNKDICWCVIRPQRFTFQFTEKYDYFTLTFFDEEHRDKLKFCGTKSGRDVDKMAETGLVPLASDNGSVYFEQARLVIECRKIYYQDIDPAHFLDSSIDEEYPEKDYHRMYLGEVLSCLVRE
jgi:flavin reductase (DIM6/NTAB) family NADH-FMN oxidoreductase RutF